MPRLCCAATTVGPFVLQEASSESDEEAQATEEGAHVGAAAAVELRRELAPMKLMALQSRAVAEGVSPDALEEAMESGNPKKQLVSLLVSHLGASAAAAHERRQKLRGELRGLRLVALQLLSLLIIIAFWQTLLQVFRSCS